MSSARRRRVRPLVVFVEALEERQVLTSAAGVWDPSYQDWLSTPVSFAAGDVATFDDFLQQDVDAQDADVNRLIGADRVGQNFSAYTGAGYSVAVIDTGIDYRHAALGGAFGAKVIAGYDFVNNDNDPLDDNGHGTHVAGIIASTSGVYQGIAPGANLIALKVLDANGSGSFGNVERALQWVVANRATYNIVAVNLSLGTGNFNSNPYSFLEDEFSSLRSSGVFTAVASGNGFFQVGSQVGLSYPATSPNVVSVGAVWDASVGSVTWASGARDYSTAADQITSFTQRSSMLGVLAPGAFVTSTYLNGGYATMAGTSMAAPVIAAASVLIHQALDSTGHSAQANQDYIFNLMRSTGVTIVDANSSADNVTNTGLSFKRVDLFSALSAIQPATPPAPPAPSTPAPPATNSTATTAWITAVFNDLYGRAPRPSGLQFWVNQFNSGATRQSLLDSMLVNVEHTTRLTLQTYNELGLATPSTATINSWAAQLSAGLPYEQMLAAVLSSNEYYDAAGGTNQGFINKLYQDLYGRAPTSGESIAGLAILQNTSRTAFANNMLYYGEFRGEEVKDWFRDYLNREARASGVNFFVNLWNDGLGRAGIQSQILLSTEYQQLAVNTYGSSSSLEATGAPQSASAAAVGWWLPSGQGLASSIVALAPSAVDRAMVDLASDEDRADRSDAPEVAKGDDLVTTLAKATRPARARAIAL